MLSRTARAITNDVKSYIQPPVSNNREDIIIHCGTNDLNCEKYQNFNWFPAVEILWKRTVSAEFRPMRLKLCRNYAFLNFIILCCVKKRH